MPRPVVDELLLSTSRTLFYQRVRLRHFHADDDHQHHELRAWLD